MVEMADFLSGLIFPCAAVVVIVGYVFFLVKK